MNHKDKIDWMIAWAHRNKVILELEGECGFCRECVGIIKNDTYPDYEWYDDDYNEISGNDVWFPDDAYHKHPCVAVLGRGEKVESQLYDWLKWFDDNGFVVESGYLKGNFDSMDVLFGKDKFVRMVKKCYE